MSYPCLDCKNPHVGIYLTRVNTEERHFMLAHAMLSHTHTHIEREQSQKTHMITIMRNDCGWICRLISHEIINPLIRFSKLRCDLQNKGSGLHCDCNSV